MIYQLNLLSCSTFFFAECVFLLILKTCKVIPIYKKDSQLNCSNYQPKSLLSNIDKILEKIMYNGLYKFLETDNLIYRLQFGFRQKHSTSHALIHPTILTILSKNFNNSIKKINKQVDHDLKYLLYWLYANKICLNVSKTEIVLFKSIRKQTEATLKLK